MQDNFEHFNWEDLFKDYSKDPQETAILNLPELDSLTNEECTTVVVSSVMKTLPKTPCKQASQRYELQTSLPNEDRQNTEDMRDIGTMMMTQQESSSELPDIFGHETFFDDVIKDTFNTSGDLTGCYGDGRVWKEEEVDAASWKEVSAILEQNGGFHKDKKLKVEDEDWTFMDAPSNQDNGETLKDGGNGLLFNSVDFNNDTNASDGNKVGVFEEVPYLWVVNDNQTEGCNNIVNIVTNNKNVTPSNFKSVHFASDLVSNKFCNDRNLSFSSEKDTNSKIKKGLKRKIQLKSEQIWKKNHFLKLSSNEYF